MFNCWRTTISILSYIIRIELICQFSYIFSNNSWNNKRRKKWEGEGETKRSNPCYFISYISIYNSHFALIFLTKKNLYCIYNRHCLLHFLYPNFYCTFPHGESLFCSSSFSFLFLLTSSPFIHHGANFLFFRIENDRHGKNDRESSYDTTNVRDVDEGTRMDSFRDRFLDERKFSKHRDIFFIALQWSSSLEKLNVSY